MSSHDIRAELKSIADAEDFPSRSAELVRQWTTDSVGIDAMGSILRFLEENPSIDLGSPGPLVHFMETFDGQDYLDKLLESVHRRPVEVTVWMLNRLLNSVTDAGQRRRLVAVLETVPGNPSSDAAARELAEEFLQHLSSRS
jgi:hypothetical protein